MVQTVALLNDEPSPVWVGPVLRELVDAWLAHDRDPAAWSVAPQAPAANRALAVRLENWLRREPARISTFFEGARLLITPTGVPAIEFGPGKPTPGSRVNRFTPLAKALRAIAAQEAQRKLAVEDDAFRCLLSLIYSEHCGRVGRCDRLKCGRYFFARTAHGNKRFCSRSCTLTESAIRATQVQRADERTRKLRAASEALKRVPARQIEQWKVWVVKHAGRDGAGLTLNFLTRAVSRGDLVPPNRRH